MRVLRRVVYMMKRKGPRTPQENVYKKDRLLSHLTRKQQDNRYDVNQSRTMQWFPNQDEKRVINIDIKNFQSTYSQYSVNCQKQQGDREGEDMILSVILRESHYDVTARLSLGRMFYMGFSFKKRSGGKYIC